MGNEKTQKGLTAEAVAVFELAIQLIESRDCSVPNIPARISTADHSKQLRGNVDPSDSVRLPRAIWPILKT